MAAFESDSLEETIRHFEGTNAGKEEKVDNERTANENRAERSIHAHRTHESVGWNRKYAARYDDIDWSK